MQSDFMILHRLKEDALFSAFLNFKAQCDDAARTAFLRNLYERNAQDDFSKYVKDKILYDENVFSVSCARKEPLSPYIEQAFLTDLKNIISLVYGTAENGCFSLGNALPKDAEAFLKECKKVYERYGYGDFIRYRAFGYENGKLVPIESPSPVQLSDLKDYEVEKKVISSNLESFLNGLPYADMLLYGERGTGKSSTVHAMLNHYFRNGLRLVELSKENMLFLSEVKEKLREIPLKFIVYIDDLSLSAGDGRISSLKAALEGGAAGNTLNSMIVATSNRRHIIDEKFSGRADSVHAGDSMQEELSLSDRFGVSVLFSSTDKAQYLSIVRQLATEKNLQLSVEELDLLAERWAISKGGRSPRRAKQFIDLAFSLSSRGLPIVF